MSLWMLSAIAVATIGFAIAIRLPPRKKVCPACSQRALVLTSHLIACGPRSGQSIESYRCTSCASEWRDHNHQGLVTLEAYLAGAREPIPTAKVEKS